MKDRETMPAKIPKISYRFTFIPYPEYHNQPKLYKLVMAVQIYPSCQVV